MKKNIKLIFPYACVVSIIIIISLILLFNLMNSEKDEVQDRTKEKVTIKFISSWAGTDTKARALEKIISEFEEKNPDVSVENKSISGSEFLFTLKTNFAQGNDPDVFGLWPGSDIKILIKAGKVANLSKALEEDEEWRSTFGDDAWGYNEFNGGIYGIPCEIIYEGLFINKDLFEQYDIKIPSNYEELKEAISDFNKAGIIPIAYNSTPEGTYIYQNIVAKLGGKNATENPYEGGKIQNCYVDAMTYMKELYELKAFPEDAYTLDDKERDDLFRNKRAAMIVQGSWFIGEGAIDGNDKTVELIPFPEFPSGQSLEGSMIYGLGNGNFHISEKAWENDKKREACLRFLKFLTSHNSAIELSESSGFISNIKVLQNQKMSRLNAMGKKLVDNSKELIGPTDSFVDRNKWEQILVPNFPKVLEGTLTPEEVFEKMK